MRYFHFKIIKYSHQGKLLHVNKREYWTEWGIHERYNYGPHASNKTKDGIDGHPSFMSSNFANSPIPALFIKTSIPPIVWKASNVLTAMLALVLWTKWDTPIAVLAKIRTYNYPQGRITDHRINKTIYNLSNFMNGDIQEMIDALIMAENAEKLNESKLDEVWLEIKS